MRKTGFAGLTVIEADQGDSIYADGGSFLERNPEITDGLLRVGALTHRHDGHAPLLPPAAAPVLTTALGGQLLGSTTLYVGVTALDAEGGETLVSPIANITTPPPLPAPGAPAAVADYTAGELVPGSYSYAISVTDGRGGETLVGTPVELLLAYGNAMAQVHLTGLAALVAASGGTGWRLYRSIAGAPWAYLTNGVADAITDDGTLCADCSALAPSVNSTNNTGVINVNTGPLPVGATRFRIYAGVTASLASPSLFGDYPASEAVNAQPITVAAFAPGSPPAVATSVGGASLIDPETQLEDFHWRRPVTTQAALPVDSDEGDVRLTIDTGDLWAFLDDGWVGPINAGPDVTVGADSATDVDLFEFEAGAGIGLELTGAPGTAHLKIVNTAASGGAAVGVRGQAVHTTAALAAAAGESTTLAIAKTFTLLALAVDAPARVRLYTEPAKRDADIARPQVQTPTGDHGLIAEFVFAAGQLSYQLAPMAVGADLKNIPDGQIAARIDNRGVAGAAVTVTATHVPIEA
jgi:hypothetical protein